MLTSTSSARISLLIHEDHKPPCTGIMTHAKGIMRSCMKISVMLLPARVDVFRRHVHPSRVVASCLRWRKSQHCATARRRVAELEMIELHGVEDGDIMKLRIVVCST